MIEKYRLTSALALAALLVPGPALAHEGDGRFTDNGVHAAHSRYELDLGPVDLERTGQREFRFADLPSVEFAFGLRLKASGVGTPGHRPRATVRMALVNEKDELVFEVAGELSNWLWSESGSEWLVYQRGKQTYIPVAPRAMKPERVSPGPDGGWGTYFLPRTSGRYRLVFETVTADAGASGFAARLVAVAGGWK